MDMSEPVTSKTPAPKTDEMGQDDTQPVAEGVPPIAAPEQKAKKAKSAPKAPSADRPPGKSLLPITRVQRILKADKELPSCSKEAVFLISVSAEEFVKRLGRAGQQQANKEKRSTVQRKDIATAVRKVDEFVFLEEFLSAGVPTPPAPAKRKPKANATVVHDGMGITDAFGKEKVKSAADAGSSDEEGGRLKHHDTTPADMGNPAEGSEDGDDDAMDIS